MDLPKNPFKRAIAEGRQQFGLWCSSNDSTIAEMLAGCGYDWMLIDTEHTALDPLAVLPILQAVAPYATHPIVRPSSLDPAEIKKLLDCGAQSILVPYVQTVEEARLAAASVAYPPDGMRGVAGITRASRFGSIPDYHQRAREQICLIVQIETLRALDALEEIAAVDGIDAVFIGPSDLAACMDHPGEPSHPDVKAVCLDAMKRLGSIGKPGGFLTLDQAFLEEIIDAGSIFTAVDVDVAILRRGALDRLEGWRARDGRH